MEPRAKYPKPDRSDYKGTGDPDEVELYQYEGLLADGRPFRAEVWWWDGLEGVTYIFSRRDLENAKQKEILALFAASGEPKIVPPEHQDYERSSGGLQARPDTRGEPMWFYSFHLGSSCRVRFKEGGVLKTVILPRE
jgi:hypothetical protein